MADEAQHAGKKRRFDEVEGEVGVKAALTSSGAEEDEYRSKIMRMLTPLPKEALVEVLADLGSKYQQVYDEVYRVANSSELTRKLFVHSLPYEVSTDAVRRAFEECGEVETAHVVTDKLTGKCKGFGFVTFKTVDAAMLAIAKNEFTVDGRTAKCHLACERDSNKRDPMPPPPSSREMGPPMRHHPGSMMPAAMPSAYGGTNVDVSQRKLFVRGLPFAVTDDALRQLFMPYGEVEEAVIIKEKGTTKSRGYGFVTMRFLEGAQAALARPPRGIMDREIIVSLAAAGKDAGGGGSHAPAPMAPAMMGGYGMMPVMSMGYGMPDAHGMGYSGMMSPYGMSGHGHMQSR